MTKTYECVLCCVGNEGVGYTPILYKVLTKVTALVASAYTTMTLHMTASTPDMADTLIDIYACS